MLIEHTLPFKKVLIVDDSPVAMMLNRSFLKKIGGQTLQLISCTTVREALEIIEEQSFDLYLIDYLMEDNRTGLEVLQKIRLSNAKVPVIILTGNQERGKDIELLKQGASDFLSKDGLTVAQLERSLRFAWERTHFLEERSKYEQEKQSLMESIRGLEKVLGVVGHELRTPLAGMRAMAEFLREGEITDPKELDGGLDSIIIETVRLSALVNNLLEVTRLNSGNVRWNWGEVDFVAACQDALRSIYPLVDQNLVELIVEVDPSCSVVNGDQSAITRLIHNLVINSVKNTAVGQITVSVTPVDSAIAICVRDTGRGIAPECLSQLGKEFQLSSANTGGSYIEGSGLGISIVKSIASAHGGSITIDSQVDKGTLVQVLIKTGLMTPVQTNCVGVGVLQQAGS